MGGRIGKDFTMAGQYIELGLKFSARVLYLGLVIAANANRFYNQVRCFLFQHTLMSIRSLRVLIR